MLDVGRGVRYINNLKNSSSSKHLYFVRNRLLFLLNKTALLEKKFDNGHPPSQMPKRKRPFSFDVFRKSSLVKNLNKNSFCKDFLSFKRHFFGNIFYLKLRMRTNGWVTTTGGVEWETTSGGKSQLERNIFEYFQLCFFCWCNFLNKRILALLLQAGNWHFPFLLKIADGGKSSYTTTLKKWVLVQKKHFWTFWALLQKKHFWLLSKTA